MESHSFLTPFIERKYFKSPLLCALALLSLSLPACAAELPSDLRAHLVADYSTTKSNYLATPGNTTNAWIFARACFLLADNAIDDSHRASFAKEGIDAAHFAADICPKSAPAHYYLALNIGALAQTKSLGALKLVKQMEQEFLKSIALDPGYDHAGAERSLGMLYRDTPGWPTSIGNKSKAREQLERAIKLAPDFPDNHLTLMEAYIKWDDVDSLQSAIMRYRKLLPDSRQKYSAPEWRLSWQDWNKRWNDILSKYSEM